MEELWNAAEPVAGGYREGVPLRLAPHLAEARVVDVREPHEFSGELGHVPGAELVPLATLESACMGWDRDALVVLVCRSGRRSADAASRLVARGFQRVINLRGGMVAYGQGGLVTAGSPAGAKGAREP